MTSVQSYSKSVDTSYAVETPEGVEIIITPAGLCPRVLAYLIDLSIRAVFLFIIGIVLMFFGSVGVGIMLVLSFIAEWFYPVFFEVYRNGVTPGKKALGLMVLNDDGTPLRFSTSMLRNLLRVVDFMPLGYFVGIVTISLNSKFKRLGDLSAGTVVVYREDLVRENTKTNQAFSHFVLPKEIQALSFEHQKAVIEFGERAEFFSMARQVELARILSPLVGSADQETSEILKRSANKLMGR
tara:strand:+ start:12365 stop:13084 length:720 start_codon:yes stop_codon:yes gene_type:complete